MSDQLETVAQEPAQRRRRARQPALNSLAPVAASAGTQGAPGRTELRPSASATTGTAGGNAELPAEIRDRFLRVGREYFFPDGAPAFRDEGRRLTTRSENTEIIRTLLLIGQSRGWDVLKAAGTDAFRRTAWELGVREGLKVIGYAATAVEKARTERRAERVAEAPSSSAAASTPGSEAARRKSSVIQGWLVSHGAAAYQFKPDEARSYYVRLQTDQGERTIWGTDLERAIRAADPAVRIGEPVTLKATGRDRVTVRSRGQSGDGDEGDVRVHRNSWAIERDASREPQASQSSGDTKDKPAKGPRADALTDAFLHLKAAEALAEERITRPEDRGRFVFLVQSALARMVAEGRDLPAARLTRDVAQPAVRKTEDRELVR